MTVQLRPDGTPVAAQASVASRNREQLEEELHRVQRRIYRAQCTPKSKRSKDFPQRMQELREQARQIKERLSRL